MNIKNIYKIIFLILFIFHSNKAVSDNKYICFPKDLNTLGLNGKLLKRSFSIYSHLLWNGETKSLKVHYFDGDFQNIDNMEILQKGTNMNPLVVLHEEKNLNTGENFTSFFKVRTYRPSELPFIFLRGSQFLSGNCIKQDDY